MSLPPVIGICGAMGAGKSTLAKELERRGYARVSMAAPLKEMLLTLGLTEQDVHGPQEHRARPSPFLGGQSPRHAMQTLGTQWGRLLISPDIWVNAVQERIIRIQTRCAAAGARGKSKCVGVVIEDIRFPNEWAMVHRLGGHVWRIRRPAVEARRTRLDALVHSKRWGPFVQPFVPVLRFFGFHPLHESEYHWPDAPADAEFWNTGSEKEMLAQVQCFLKRIHLTGEEVPCDPE